MAASRCPGCHEPTGADAYTCPSCRAVYHPACFKVQRCIVAGCTNVKIARASGLSYSQRWSWVTRVNGLVAALVAAIVMRGHRPEHLVPNDLFSLLAFVTALASAYGTYYACKEDLNDHGLPDGGRRPDHYGSYAWMVYMGGVLTLYTAFFALVIPPVGFMLAGLALMLQFPIFGLGFLTCVVGLFVDKHKLRALIGIPFPMIALMVGGISLQPFIGHPRPKSYTRACYANQKTIAGAVEMYNLDHKTKRDVLDDAFFNALKSGGYLQSIPQDPGSGAGSSSNYQLMGTNFRCTVHGAIQ